MSLGDLLKAGLGCVLDAHLVGILFGASVEKDLVKLHEHFTLTGADLGLALQESFGYATAAIGLGISPEEEASSLVSRLLKVEQLGRSSVTRTYSAQVEERYLVPFARAHDLRGDGLEVFRAKLVAACRELSRAKAEILPPDRVPEPDVARLIRSPQVSDVSAIILDLAEAHVPVPRQVHDFLAGDGLLGDALLFFFREKVRKDPRVERTLAHWERHGIWADVSDSKEGLTRLESALKTRMDEVQSRIVEEQRELERASQAGAAARTASVERELKGLRDHLSILQDRLAHLPLLFEEVTVSVSAVSQRLSQFEKCLGTLTELTTARLDEIVAGLSGLAGGVREARDAAREAARKVDGLSADLAGMAQILERNQNDILAALREVVGQLGPRTPAAHVPAAADTPAAVTEASAIVRFLAYIEQDEPPFAIRIWSEPAGSRATRNVAVVPKRHRASYVVGDSVRIHFHADRPCYVHLINIGPTGDITFLFPNKLARDHRVEANRVYSFPRDEDGFDFVLQPPVGTEVIKALATLVPVNLLETDPAKLPDLFLGVPADRRLRNLAVMARKVADTGPAGWSSSTCEIEVGRNP